MLLTLHIAQYIYIEMTRVNLSKAYYYYGNTLVYYNFYEIVQLTIAFKSVIIIKKNFS